MPTINNCHQARSEISSFCKLHNNSIAFSTKYHGAKIINPQECEAKYSFKNQYLNFSVTAVCFSPDAKLIAYSNETHLYIADIKSKEIIKRVFLDAQKVSILMFDSSSNYIVAGTGNGRVLLFKYNLASKLSRLCSFAYKNSKTKESLVSAIEFHKNLLAVSGYGGTIFVIDILSGSSLNLATDNNKEKKALCFIDEDTIICGDSEGTIFFISITQNRVVKTINLPLKQVSQIVSIPNTKYLIVHASTDTIFIIDSKEYKVLHKDYIKFKDEITFVESIDAQTLVVALKNLKILRVELPNTERLNSLILHNSLYEAYELLETQPMLHNTKEHRILEKMFDKSYQDATNALINQNKELAHALLQAYKNIESKQESIKLLFKSFDNYNRFKTLYLEKKYALAYAMATKYPVLKTTVQYESMEAKWKETFANAQRHILMGKPSYAKALLSEYITVTSKRPIIELILKHNNLFIEFLKALDKKDFKKVNEIARKNTLFTKIPMYENLDRDIQKSIYRIEAYIKKNRLDLARKSLAKIDGTPNFTQKVLQLHSMCDEMQRLQDAYQKDDFYTCYNLIDEFTHLSFTQLGEFLQKHWLKLMSECEEYALRGNIQSIKAVLGELITLDGRKDRIGDLLRVSFQVQIKYFISKEKFKSAQSVIYSYIDIFTKDVEIVSLMSKYESMSGEKLAITLGEDNESSRDSWRDSKLIVD